jgi:hypothetical protein
MNKNEFVGKFSENDVLFSRHGSRHDIYIHSPTGKKIAIPRHVEFSNVFLKKILQEIPES